VILLEVESDTFYRKEEELWLLPRPVPKSRFISFLFRTTNTKQQTLSSSRWANTRAVFLSSKTQSAIEYPDPDAAQDPHDLQDTSYIECKSNEIFSIQFTVKPSKLGVLRGKNLAFFTEIDGKRISYGAVCGVKGFHSKGNQYDYKMEGELTSTASGSALSRFKFAEVQKGRPIFP
jgi:hypothetical protein